MMHSAAYGRLGQDPREIETRSGKMMTVASLAVDIGDEEGGPEWLGLVAFGTVAEQLSRHGKGDCLSASGRLQRNRYTTRAGEERCQLQIVCDSVVSARTVRPGGGRKRRDELGEPLADSPHRPLDRDPNDDLPF